MIDYIEYSLKRRVLAPMKLKNGMLRLIKIEKGTVYKYNGNIDNEGNIILAKRITKEEDKFLYKDCVKLKRKELEDFFVKLGGEEDE